MTGYYQQLGDSGDRNRRFFSLTLALVAREFKGQYRRSLLGPAWALLQPAAYLVVFSLLRGVLAIPSEGLPYALFSFCALVPWTFFSNAVIRCGPSIGANAGILKKVAVRKEVFPAAAVATSFLDFLISAVFLVGMLIWYHAPLGWNLLWLPVLVLLTALLALGLGMGLGAIGAFRRDLLFAVPFLMQFWLLATPVLYPLGQVPTEWSFWYQLNPMVGIIEGFRAVLARGEAPDPVLLLTTVAMIGVIWLVCWPLFRLLSQYFADVL